MQGNTLVILLISILAAAAVAAGTWLVWRRRHHQALIRKYGPEYRRIVREEGDPRKAERELEARERRVSHFQLRELAPAERERYLDEWRRVQTLFVDEPAGAVTRAHELLMAVMRDRGYPDAELEQRQRDLSVHYPDLIEAYREACEIAARHAASGAASTEDLRRATICHRTLVTALLNGEATPVGAPAHTHEVAS